jgi:hypothetical protein
MGYAKRLFEKYFTVTLGTFIFPLTPLKKGTVYTGVYISRITPLNPPDIKGGNRKSSSLPFTRGGLGWGKTLVHQVFQTCVYTVA